MKILWILIVKIKDFMKKLNNDCVDAYSTQAAFFIMLSFIPFIILLLSAIQFIPVTEADFLKMITNTVPSYLQPIIISIVEEAFSNSGRIISVSAVTAVWSSAKGFLSLNKGLNKIYNVEETRNYIYLRLRACVMILILLVTIILALIMLVFGNRLQALLIMYFPIIAEITKRILDLKILIMIGIFIVIFVVIFTYIPNRKTKLSNQIPGAVLCAISWYAFSFFFSIYVDFSNTFSKMYGSLSAAAVIMLWLYISMYILLICAEINSYFEDFFIKYKIFRAARKGNKKNNNLPK